MGKLSMYLFPPNGIECQNEMRNLTAQHIH